MTRARDLAKGTFSGDLTVDTNTLVVDSANNRVGVGTASPSSALHVAGSFRQTGATVPFEWTVNAGAADFLKLNAVGYADNLLVANSSGNVGIGTSSPSSALTVGAGGTARFNRSDNATYNEIKYVTSGDLFYFNQANGGAYQFNISGVEKVRIDSSGNLLVGTTSWSSGSNGISIGSNSNSRLLITNSTDFGLELYGATSNRISFSAANGAATRVGSISVTNGSTSYNTSSDYRLKTDAQPMTGASDRVLALNPVNFEWISDGTRVDGFLAHEAQAVVPECVTGTKDAMRDEEYEVTAAVLDADGMVVTEAVMGTRSVPDYQGIDQSKLVPLLTAALQEALTKIDAMETRLAALEAV
jgi:hypothetical protein